MPGVTTAYMEALGKQIFAKDFILNGLFPCNSPFVKQIGLKKIDWKFNDKFEYRMLMANTNSGGTIQTQTFDHNFKLQHPGELEYNIFQATYGVLMDGFEIDMVKQLETREARASFNKEYAMQLHSMRINVASMYKSIIMNGRYGVVHRVMPPLFDSQSRAEPVRYIPKIAKADQFYPNGLPKDAVVWTDATTGTHGDVTGGYTFSLKAGDHIRIDVPRNVWASNFKQGRLISRAGADDTPGITDTTGCPWGKSDVAEMYVVYDNQPKVLELVYIGAGTITGWNYGDVLELAGFRKCTKAVWKKYHINHVAGGISDPDYKYNSGLGVVNNWRWEKEGGTTLGVDYYSEATGAMEGIADLIPWYTKYQQGVTQFETNQQVVRQGLKKPFRGQPNRTRYTTEQSGMLVLQTPGMSIMDALMEGVELAVSVCDYENVVIFMNPTTLTAIGMYEQMAGGNANGLQVFKEGNLDSKLIYQRGITSISFRIGDKIIPDVVKDYNIPTDIILMCPKNDISYNCWDNAAFELQQYIQSEWTAKKPPAPKDIQVPKELATKLDISQRIIYGAPVADDLKLANPGFDPMGTNISNNGFVHPSNSVPVAYQEMGALFTENPYAYTVVKLCNQIISPSDVLKAWWSGKEVA